MNQLGSQCLKEWWRLKISSKGCGFPLWSVLLQSRCGPRYCKEASSLLKECSSMSGSRYWCAALENPWEQQLLAKEHSRAVSGSDCWGPTQALRLLLPFLFTPFSPCCCTYQQAWLSSPVCALPTLSSYWSENSMDKLIREGDHFCLSRVLEDMPYSVDFGADLKPLSAAPAFRCCKWKWPSACGECKWRELISA